MKSISRIDRVYYKSWDGSLRFLASITCKKGFETAVNLLSWIYEVNLRTSGQQTLILLLMLTGNL